MHIMSSGENSRAKFFCAFLENSPCSLSVFKGKWAGTAYLLVILHTVPPHTSRMVPDPTWKLVALGAVSMPHYITPFTVGDIGLGAGFGNTQFNGDFMVM